jgi:toxin ParE1/3/4
MKVRWLTNALNGLVTVRVRLAEENPRAARNVADRIERSVSRLAEFPASGPEGTVQGTREVVVTGLPYVLVYRVVGSEVHILRLFHQKQDRQ